VAWGPKDSFVIPNRSPGKQVGQARVVRFRAIQHFQQRLVLTTRNHEQIKTVYILGDFFEFWIGDDYQSDYILEIFQQLSSISETGIQCQFMHGNRDFLIGHDFEQQTGFKLIPDTGANIDII